MSVRLLSSIWRVLLLGTLLSCRWSSTVSSGPPVAGPAPIAEGTLVLFSPPDSGESLDIGRYRFVLPTQLRGRTFRFVADHGADATMITDSTITAAGLPHRFAKATRADTLVKRGGVEPVRDSTAVVTIIRGDSIFQYWGDVEAWIIDSLRVAVSLQESLFVATESPAMSLHPADGLLGRDILSQFDLEFNLPQRAVRLYARSAAGPDGNPRWLPAGMTAADCVTGQVIPHMGMDTTGMDSTNRAEMQTTAALKRLWDSEELLLPLVVNGHTLAAHFDSGAGETSMNWAAARMLGLDRTSPTLTAVSASEHMIFHFGQPPSVGTVDTMTYRATGITLRTRNRALPADGVLISESAFADFDDFQTKPILFVGLREFRDNVLFFSYSTGRVCVGPPVVK